MPLKHVNDLLDMSTLEARSSRSNRGTPTSRRLDVWRIVSGRIELKTELIELKAPEHW